MVSRNEETLVHGIRISSVGPGQATGQGMAHEPTNTDLAMKLHYLRLVYYFPREAAGGLTIKAYKDPMFTLLNRFYVACGRFRRAESGRAYIKCNDCGVRFIEAHCGGTVDEWLEMSKKDGSLQNLLVYGQPIGPELQFSPLVLLQLTTFKCGGVSLGLSWAHVLGDVYVAAEFMATLGQVMAGEKLAHLPIQPQTHTEIELSSSPDLDTEGPLSLKRVGPVGDHWTIPNTCKMGIFSFLLDAKQIGHLQSKVCGEIGHKIPAFESLCAIIWRSVAKTRNESKSRSRSRSGSEPKLVTICKNDPQRDETNIMGNGQVISVVAAEFPIADANLDEIGAILSTRAVDDRRMIVEAVERDLGLSNFIFYGANLTFLDAGCANIYGFEMRGIKPVFASCTIDGVGEEGVVLVIPDTSDGKVVTLIVPEDEVSELKSELERELEIA